MKQHLEDETELRRYLLGELALKERVLIEERLFLDDDFLLRVKAVEDDLIDDYVYDELTAGEREKFETHFLDKPGGRDDLRIAEALKRYISSETEAAETAAHAPAPDTHLSTANSRSVAQPPARERDSFLASLFGRRPLVGWSFATVAALIIISVIVWFAVESANRQERERALQAQDSAPPPETAPVERGQHTSPVNSPVNAGDPGEASETAERPDTKRGGTEEDIRRRAGQSRQPAGQTAGRPRDTSPTPRQTPTRVVAFLILPGGSIRGGGGSNSVEVSSDVGTVILRLPLAGRDEYDTYRATLQTGGRTTRTWAGLKPETDAEFGQFVPVPVPARLLRQQSYQVKLSGITATGQIHNLTSHAFQVERK